MARNYPGYATALPDQIRAQIFLNDLRKWEEHGSMPNLMLIQLPADRTVGTVALAVSPGTRLGAIDSTFYAHQSILKTIESMLGLPPLSLFDLIATDMRNAFQNTPDSPPYRAVEPKQSLLDENPPAAALRGAERRPPWPRLPCTSRSPTQHRRPRSTRFCGITRVVGPRRIRRAGPPSSFRWSWIPTILRMTESNPNHSTPRRTSL